VTFAPNPANPAFGTPPIFVEAREVSLLKEIPEGIRHLTFHDVVVSVVRVGDKLLTLESDAFNDEHHHVTWDLDAALRHVEMSSQHDVQVEVPPHLTGKVWVFEPLRLNRARAA
jgi:hypothetical protein